MAFGFKTANTIDFQLDGLTHQEFLVIANETIKEIKDKVVYRSDAGLIVQTKKGVFYSAEVTRLIIDNELVKFESTMRGNSLRTWQDNFIHKFNALRASLTPDELSAKYEEIRATIVPPEKDILLLPKPTIRQQFINFLSLFVPKEGYFITPILMNLNILMFVLMVAAGISVFNPSPQTLINLGGNFRPLTLNGQWWRLITNCFLHFGLIHLLMNMYALVYIGLLLEPYLGKARYIAAYLLTGITASITSLWWHDLTVSAGASGAIFGMYGVFLAMLTTNLIEASERKALLTSISIFIGYNLLFGMKGNIDNAAHIGGLIGGIIIGYAFIPSLKNPESVKLRLSAIALSAVLLLSISFVVYKKIPNDSAVYAAKFNEFTANEEVALSVYKMDRSSTKQQMLYAIHKGINYWNADLKIINELNQLNVPDGIHQRDELLRKYCNLRLKCYGLMYKSINEGTKKYETDLFNYNGEIQTMIQDLKNKSQ